MKKLKISLVAFLIGLTLSAQDTTKTSLSKNEVKLDLLGIFTNSLNVSFERKISNDVGVQLRGSFYKNRILFDNPYQRVGLIADSKIYFPNNRVGGHFFIGPSIGVQNLYRSNYTYSTEHYNEAIYEHYLLNHEASAKTLDFLAGFNIGQKWNTDSGFVFEISGSYMRALLSKTTVKDPDKKLDFNKEDARSQFFGIEMSADLLISVGYQF